MASEPEIERVLVCAVHGPRRWNGHLMCCECGRVYQTTDRDKPRAAPEACVCGVRLMPPKSAQVGDPLGLSVETSPEQRRAAFDMLRPEATDAERDLALSTEQGDFAARPICTVCFRRVVKYSKGRLDIQKGGD